jgi:hypothetical protein
MQGREGGDELVAAFARWAAEQRTVSAAGSRSRERSLREQAAASATWAGTLVDLAERGAPVTAVIGQDRRSGRIVGVGQDFFVLDTRSGRHVLVVLGAVDALWPDQTASPLPAGPAGDRGGAIDLTMMMALALLAEERAPICLTTTSGIDTAGDLLAAGEDVLTVRTEAPNRRLAHVPFSAVAICELR